MKVLIDIPQDHKRVIDNLVSDGKDYLLPQEVETRIAKEIKRGTVIHNNCEMCERYDKTGKTECNGCKFELAYIPLVLIKQAREEIEQLKHKATDVEGYRWWNNAIENCLQELDKLIESEEINGR